VFDNNLVDEREQASPWSQVVRKKLGGGGGLLKIPEGIVRQTWLYRHDQAVGRGANMSGIARHAGM